MAKSKVVFLHPDLGLGGAERLAVDAALALKGGGYQVSFVTSHHNRDHCFSETVDGTLPVTVVGDWLPRSIFGKFYALCAYVRMIYSALYIVLFLKPDLVFCDLVSACVPILRLSGCKVLFYCHFPDRLLSKKGGFLKHIYRIPLDWIEEFTTDRADVILVNSKFTRYVFKDTFRGIKKTPAVLYPSINTKFFDDAEIQSLDFLEPALPRGSFVFLSINRYERKKHVELAINAFGNLKSLVSAEIWNNVRLIIGGGYDRRVVENIEYYSELQNIASELELADKVYFLKSPSDLQKVALLRSCNVVVYTPPNEHFGIVPLEAMYHKKPVIAVKSGGPTETILDLKTGYLSDFDSTEFAKAMAKVVLDNKVVEQMGEAGYKRFCEMFSFEAFSKQLNSIVTNMVQTHST
ncbi:hypothetical protein AAG570_010967 [Ranatra chinensis]|uniref:Alpha-1,3/1,6-mannosyltransferase ALG2 n=1 Tax=Ranatra chinensis TaxID=642074 RepID=A0ABD0YJI6_9HEMI